MVSVHKVTEVVMVYASMASETNKVMANTSVKMRVVLWWVIGLIYGYPSLGWILAGLLWVNGLGFGFRLEFYWLLGLGFGFRFGFGFG